MAFVVYFLKSTKRIVFSAAVLLLTCIAILSVRQENDDEYFAEYSTSTEMYKNNNKNGRFILLWTDPTASPFHYLGKGSHVFREKSCEYTNCYVTADRQELGDISLFDVILFNGPQIERMLKSNDLPNSRSVSQKYIYANIESAQNYPICHFNGFFNWTWTYRLDSDINYGYYVVKNKTGHVVAPKLDTTWENVDNLEDISENLKAQLSRKTKAAAWFATNCHTKSRREDFVDKVNGHLKNLSLSVDTYGACGSLQCPSFINERCLHLLEEEYHFYFAFENSLSKDYLTEKILSAYRHNTVPVVYGGADYSRFLPPDSYLDARDLGPEKLAQTMEYLIKNPVAYYKYFRWQKHYTFHYRHESRDTDDYCRLCEILNSDRLYETTVRQDIKEWWNGNYSCDGVLLKQ